MERSLASVKSCLIGYCNSAVVTWRVLAPCRTQLCGYVVFGLARLWEAGLPFGLAVVTASADPEHIEAVASSLKACASKGVVQARGEVTFCRHRHDEVIDRATRGADEVVVMADDLFGEFESSSVVATENLLNDSRPLQVDHVSIHRALGQRGAEFEQLRNRRWSAKFMEQRDEFATAFRIHLLAVAKSLVDQLVDGFGFGVAGHRIDSSGTSR